MSDEDPIGRSLGVSPSTTTIERLEQSSNDDSAKKDFAIARANIHTLIETGKESFERLAEIAEASQHPRAFEVLGKLMDSLVSANRELLDLQQKVRDLNSPDSQVNNIQGPRTLNQTSIFIGSTHELQRAIREMGKIKAIDVEPDKPIEEEKPDEC